MAFCPAVCQTNTDMPQGVSHPGVEELKKGANTIVNYNKQFGLKVCATELEAALCKVLLEQTCPLIQSD